MTGSNRVSKVYRLKVKRENARKEGNHLLKYLRIGPSGIACLTDISTGGLG